MNMEDRTNDIINRASKQYAHTLKRLGQENDVTEFMLTPASIVMIHDAMCDRYGGTKGTRDKGLLDSVCVAPYQDIFGKELYPTIFDKAAKYLMDFSRYQVFLDGNKRIGLTAAVCLLLGNGYKMTASQLQMYDLTMDIAAGKIKEVQWVSEFLHDHCTLDCIPYSQDDNDIEQEQHEMG